MKSKRAQNKKKHFELFSVLVVMATLFMSVAFANISNVKLVVKGNLTAPIQDGVFITDITEASASGVNLNKILYYKGTTISSSIELSENIDVEPSLVYNISLFNNSGENYYFSGITYDKDAYDNTNIIHSVIGMSPYVTVIHPREELSFLLEFKYAKDFSTDQIQILNSMLNFSFSNEMIEFAILKEKYTAPKGATWEQFVESEYNTYGFSIAEEKIYTKDGKEIYNNAEQVKVTDIIDAEKTYNYKPEITFEQEVKDIFISKGGTAIGTVTATLTNVAESETSKITWTSSNSNIVEVTGTGATPTITAKAMGYAILTASYGEITATCQVNVKENYVLEIENEIAGIAENYKIYGNSLQFGAPTTTNPVEIQSVGDRTKNLIDYKSIYSDTSKFDITDGVLSGNSSNLQSTKFYIPQELVGKQLTFSADLKISEGTTLNAAYLLAKVNGQAIAGQGRGIAGNFTSTYVTFTPTSTEDNICISYGSGTGTVYAKNIQLEIGDTVTEYEPYGYKIPVKASGRNLFNKSNSPVYSNSTIFDEETETGVKLIIPAFSSNTGMYSSKIYKIDSVENIGENTIYVNTDIKIVGIPRVTIALGYCDENGTNREMISTKYVYEDGKYTISLKIDTETYTGKYVGLWLYGISANGAVEVEDGSYVEYSNVMLSVGNIEYEPYVEPQTFNIYLDEPLRKTDDVVDVIDFATQTKTSQIKEIVFDGSSDEAWSLNTALTGVNRYYLKISDSYNTNINSILNQCKCTHFDTTSSMKIGNSTFAKNHVYIFTGTVYFYTDPTEFPDVASWKAWLEQNNVNLQYKTATAENTSISLPELQMLEGYTKIEVLTNVPPSNMEVEKPVQILSLDKENLEVQLESGKTATETLTATIKNISGELTWTSTDTNVAEVVGNGNTATVTLKAAGSATITVSNGNVSATCSITVTEKTYTVSGTYTWNTNLNILNNTAYQNISETVNFTSNGTNYTVISTVVHEEYDFWYNFKYGDTVVYDTGAGPEDITGGWFDEGYKTIDFGIEPQAVSEEFYTFLTANAGQSENVEDDATHVSGVWIFNDTINFTENFSESVNYMSNNSYYYSMGATYDTGGYLLNYGDNNMVYSSWRFEMADGSVIYDMGWQSDAYKTVDFGTSSQEVSATFKTWLEANATKQ